MQREGNLTREIIKRVMPSDTQILEDSRYQSKSQIRILIDDEGNSASDAAGIPSGRCEPIEFDPVPLPSGAANDTPSSHGGGRAYGESTTTILPKATRITKVRRPVAGTSSSKTVTQFRPIQFAVSKSRLR
jgi:hypothetical protein